MRKKISLEEKKKIGQGGEHVFPVDACRALRIALEDYDTSYFIKTNFSYPEQGAKIISHKWISSYDSGYKWNVEIIETASPLLIGETEMMNIAIVEVDSATGKIIRRQFFKNILVSEYQKVIDLLFL